jgi:c-di-GMP-binding flagellar brake protein YcgR
LAALSSAGMDETRVLMAGMDDAAIPGGRERRSHVRHPVDSSAAIILVNGGARFRGRILDVSLDGCRIRSDERFLAGVYTKVETVFQLIGSTFRLGGVVQMVVDRCLVGIRFLDLSLLQRDQIVELIAEIERQQASPTEMPG